MKEAQSIGKQLKIDWSQIDVEQFRRGLEIKLEHYAIDSESNVTGDDLMQTGKIAWAHLKEIRDYYTRLDHMEAEGSFQKPVERLLPSTIDANKAHPRGINCVLWEPAYEALWHAADAFRWIPRWMSPKTPILCCLNGVWICFTGESMLTLCPSLLLPFLSLLARQNPTQQLPAGHSCHHRQQPCDSPGYRWRNFCWESGK